MNTTTKAIIAVIIVLIFGFVVYAYEVGKEGTQYGGTDTQGISTSTSSTSASHETTRPDAGAPGIVSTTTASFSLSDVAKHNSASSCWTTIRGSVYDVTSWISQHPGGEDAILSTCGIDATSLFVGQHGGQGRPERMLASFLIGSLKK